MGRHRLGGYGSPYNRALRLDRDGHSRGDGERTGWVGRALRLDPAGRAVRTDRGRQEHVMHRAGGRAKRDDLALRLGLDGTPRAYPGPVSWQIGTDER
ncbi:hypothetical protein ACLOJK_004221 [Asimina triloba]